MSAIRFNDEGRMAGQTPGPTRRWNYGDSAFQHLVDERPLPPLAREYWTRLRGLRTAQEAAQLLLKAVTMSEIAFASEQLGLTFREGYHERARLYGVRYGIWRDR